MRKCQLEIMRLASLCTALIVLTGCSRAPEPADVTMRVENGVTIVENPGLDIADSLAWSIDTTDVVRIGVVDGPDEYMFSRLIAALFLPGDEILIADGTAHELRIFDARGQFVRKTGRRGRGPGEFTYLSNVLHYFGDSILVIDREGGRANVLDPNLVYVRQFRPTLRDSSADSPGSSGSLAGFFDDGRAFFRDYLNVCRGIDPFREGFCVDSLAFFAADQNGATRARFGHFVYDRYERYRVGPGHFTGWREPHPQPIWAIQGDRFYYGDAMRFEILVFKNDGSLERRIRVGQTAPRFEKNVVWPKQDPPPNASPDIKRGTEVATNAQATAALPDTFPSFSDLLVDDVGNIWVREYLPPSLLPDLKPRWFVFDPEGRLRWSIRSPAGMVRTFRTFSQMGPQITNDQILAPARDSDGVKSVVVYQLRK
ncbi:MAG: 6-bladed beta-propeller [Gemmatimonadota bacterium]